MANGSDRARNGRIEADQGESRKTEFGSPSSICLHEVPGVAHLCHMGALSRRVPAKSYCVRRRCRWVRPAAVWGVSQQWCHIILRICVDLGIDVSGSGWYYG